MSPSPAPSPAESIATLRRVAPTLNAACDEAKAMFATIEKLLSDELHIGVTAAQAFRQNKRFCLWYGRHNGCFRFYIVEESISLSTLQYAWDQAARDVLINALDALPGLLERIADEAERLSSYAAETNRTVRAFLEAFAASPSEP